MDDSGGGEMYTPPYEIVGYRKGAYYQPSLLIRQTKANQSNHIYVNFTSTSNSHRYHDSRICTKDSNACLYCLLCCTTHFLLNANLVRQKEEASYSMRTRIARKKGPVILITNFSKGFLCPARSPFHATQR